VRLDGKEMMERKERKRREAGDLYGSHSSWLPDTIYTNTYGK
jgi:hypothetical protein